MRLLRSIGWFSILLLTAKSVLAVPPDKVGEKIPLALKLNRGDILGVTLEFNAQSLVNGKPVALNPSRKHAVKCVVEDVDAAGTHTVRLSLTLGDKPHMVMRAKVSPNGELSAVTRLDADNEKDWPEAEGGHMGLFFVTSSAAVGVGDSWPVHPFESGFSVTCSVLFSGGKVGNTSYRLLAREGGYATISLAGKEVRMGRRSEASGTIVVNEASGWPCSGDITVRNYRVDTAEELISIFTFRIVQPEDQRK